MTQLEDEGWMSCVRHASSILKGFIVFVSLMYECLIYILSQNIKVRMEPVCPINGNSWIFLVNDGH